MNDAAAPRFSRPRSLVCAATLFILCVLPCEIAHAEERPPAELGLEVGLSNGAGAGISTRVKIAGLYGSSPPPVHTLSLVGDIGSVDLRGVPTCRPSTQSPLDSGCTAPQIGAGGGFVRLQTDAESESVKLPGTIEIYSGGQRGPVSKLWAWAVFPPEGGFDPTTVLVIPMTLERKGPGRSELRVRVPEVTSSALFALLELRLSIRRNVNVDGRSIPLTGVRCPAGADAEVRAEASFDVVGPVPPAESTASPTCS